MVQIGGCAELESPRNGIWHFVLAVQDKSSHRKPIEILTVDHGDLWSRYGSMKSCLRLLASTGCPTSLHSNDELNSV